MFCQNCLRVRALRCAGKSTTTSITSPTRMHMLAARPQPTRATTLSAIPFASTAPSIRPSARNLPRLFPTRTLGAYFASTDATSEPCERGSRARHLEKPSFGTEAEGEVWDRVTAALAPTELWVQDISGGCGSMYGIEVASEKFRGLSMLKQQRLVNEALGDLIVQWHGVQIKTRVP